MVLAQRVIGEDVQLALGESAKQIFPVAAELEQQALLVGVRELDEVVVVVSVPFALLLGDVRKRIGQLVVLLVGFPVGFPV